MLLVDVRRADFGSKSINAFQSVTTNKTINGTREDHGIDGKHKIKRRICFFKSRKVSYISLTIDDKVTACQASRFHWTA